MGLDKYENEKLLKFAFPCDWWFHVKDLSSAHVYVRPINEEICHVLPNDIIQIAGTIVKNNSISGSKQASCKIVWTPITNVFKDSRHDLEIGSVSYRDSSKVSCIIIEKCKEDIKKFEKMKVDRTGTTNLETLLSEYEKRRRMEAKIKKQEKATQERLEKEQALEHKKLYSYDSLFETRNDEEDIESRDWGDFGDDDFM